MVAGIEGSNPLSPVILPPQQNNADQTKANAADQSARDTAQLDGQTALTAAANFESYLNNAAILTLETTRASDAFDTAQAIVDASVYKDPGQSSPI